MRINIRMCLSTTCRWPTPRDVFANTGNCSRNGTVATKCLSRSGDNSVALLPKFGWQEAGQGTAAKWDGKGALRYILHTVPVAQMVVVAGMVAGVHIIGTSVVMAYFRCPTSCPAIMMVVGKQCEQHEQYNCQRHVICAAGGFHYVQGRCMFGLFDRLVSCVCATPVGRGCWRVLPNCLRTRAHGLCNWPQHSRVAHRVGV